MDSRLCDEIKHFIQFQTDKARLDCQDITSACPSTYPLSIFSFVIHVYVKISVKLLNCFPRPEKFILHLDMARLSISLNLVLAVVDRPTDSSAGRIAPLNYLSESIRSLSRH